MYDVYAWMVKLHSVHYLLMIISKAVFITFACMLKGTDVSFEIRV